MIDEFILRALAAGIGIALVAGPLGCFVVWRRLAYFGDTLSHAALLGVGLALLFNINLQAAVFAVSAVIAMTLLAAQRRLSLASDSVLGLLAHSALAIGVVVLSLMTWVRIDLHAFLFGDILAVSTLDVGVIFAGGGVIIAVLIWIWPKLFAATVSHELAEAEGMAPDQVNLIFMLMLALVIAMSMKVVGALLISAMLIIPAATARRFASGPEAMAVGAAIAGVVSVVLGLAGSYGWDTPTGPSIVVAAAVLFVVSLAVRVRSRPGTIAAEPKNEVQE